MDKFKDRAALGLVPLLLPPDKFPDLGDINTLSQDSFDLYQYMILDSPKEPRSRSHSRRHTRHGPLLRPAKQPTIAPPKWLLYLT